jgi:hypothetical protein
LNHDFRQSRRLGKHGPAHSGLKWAPPEGGLRPGARPGGKDLLCKKHEAASIFMDQAGQPFEHPMKSFSPGRGDWPVARSARRMLRKPIEASRKRASPADAFCPEAPCPRATTQASRKCQYASGGPPAEPGFYLNEINSAPNGGLPAGPRPRHSGNDNEEKEGKTCSTFRNFLFRVKLPL